MEEVMYTIRVTLEGVGRGLLMHRFSTQATAALENEVKKSSREVKTPQVEAEEVAYRLPPQKGETKGQLMLPAEHFLGAIIATGSSLRMKGQGKKTYKAAFAGNIDVSPDCVPLVDSNGKPLFDYAIDSRPVVIKATRGKIVRHRPHIAAGWRVNLDLLITDDTVPLEVIQAALEEAGKSRCVGDFRPRFGQFRIVSFDKK